MQCYLSDQCSGDWAVADSGQLRVSYLILFQNTMLFGCGQSPLKLWCCTGRLYPYPSKKETTMTPRLCPRQEGALPTDPPWSGRGTVTASARASFTGAQRNQIQQQNYVSHSGLGRSPTNNNRQERLNTVRQPPTKPRISGRMALPSSLLHGLRASGLAWSCSTFPGTP